MRLRAAEAADLPAIAALHAGNWRESYRWILPPGRLGAPLEVYMAEKWTEAHLRTHSVVLAEEAGRVEGFAAYDPGHPDGAYLDNLHVAAECRGRGIGSRLMGHVADAAGDGALWLIVLSENPATRALYRGWGGVEGGVFEDRILDHPVPALKVVWADARALSQHLAGAI